VAFIIIKRDDRLGERHMAIKNNAAVRKKLRILFNLGTIGTLTDGQILERFASVMVRRESLRSPLWLNATGQRVEAAVL
jgi:hypothetical protein